MLYLLDILSYYLFKFQCTVMVIMDLHPSLYMYQESLQKRGVKVELVVCKKSCNPTWNMLNSSMISNALSAASHNSEIYLSGTSGLFRM